MTDTYRYHRRVLRLLQWHCPPNLWHLKTPVHMLWLGALSDAYPDARFLWTHRDPADVLASVCDLIAYTHSWVSDRDDKVDVGAQQLDLWSEALRRAIEFRDQVGEGRFADMTFREMQSDPIGALARAYEKLGLVFSEQTERRMAEWRLVNPPGAHGVHSSSLDDFGLDAAGVRERFGFYLDRFDLRDQ
jgi:hypothetical protein